MASSRDISSTIPCDFLDVGCEAVVSLERLRTVVTVRVSQQGSQYGSVIPTVPAVTQTPAPNRASPTPTVTESLDGAGRLNLHLQHTKFCSGFP